MRQQCSVFPVLCSLPLIELTPNLTAVSVFKLKKREKKRPRWGFHGKAIVLC